MTQCSKATAVLQVPLWQSDVPDYGFDASGQASVSCTLHRLGDLSRHAVAKKEDSLASEYLREAEQAGVGQQGSSRWSIPVCQGRQNCRSCGPAEVFSRVRHRSGKVPALRNRDVRGGRGARRGRVLLSWSIVRARAMATYHRFCAAGSVRYSRDSLSTGILEVNA